MGGDIMIQFPPVQLLSDLVRNILERNKVEVMVLNDNCRNTNEELVEDLLSILQIYVSKANGRRRYCKNKKTDN